MIRQRFYLIWALVLLFKKIRFLLDYGKIIQRLRELKLQTLDLNQYQVLRSDHSSLLINTPNYQKIHQFQVALFALTKWMILSLMLENN